MDIIPSAASKSFTSDTTFTNFLLIIDVYFKIPKLYGMEKITTEEVMDKLDMFQSIFGKIDQFGWWDLEIFSADAGTQFTSTYFKEEFQTREVHLTLAAPGHKEMNTQVEAIWRTLRTVAHSLMVHARVLEAYIHFLFMYTTDHIFPVLPIKDMINEDGVVPAPDGTIYLVDINETHFWGSLLRYMYWGQKYFSENIETYQCISV